DPLDSQNERQQGTWRPCQPYLEDAIRSDTLGAPRLRGPSFLPAPKGQPTCERFTCLVGLRRSLATVERRASGASPRPPDSTFRTRQSAWSVLDVREFHAKCVKFTHEAA